MNNCGTVHCGPPADEESVSDEALDGDEFLWQFGPSFNMGCVLRQHNLFAVPLGTTVLGPVLQKIYKLIS